MVVQVRFVNNLLKIIGDGVKNASVVFLSFFVPILILVALTSDQGIGLLWNSDIYIRAFSHPLIIGVYAIFITLSTFNSYKKLK